MKTVSPSVAAAYLPKTRFKPFWRWYKVLFGCLNGRDVSRGLILLARDFFNCMPKSGEIAHYSLQLLQ